MTFILLKDLFIIVKKFYSLKFKKKYVKNKIEYKNISTQTEINGQYIEKLIKLDKDINIININPSEYSWIVI